MRTRTALAAIGFCLFGLPGLLTGAHAAADDPASKACVECHDDLSDMKRSPHAAASDPRTPSCVSCHGASQQHADRRGRVPPDRVFSRRGGAPAGERNGACLACHTDTKRSHWGGSPHETADLSCTSCHAIHTNHDKVLAKATQTEVCAPCHKEQRTQINKPSRHPLLEAKMSCSDCHNVHGSVGPKLAKRDSTNDTCYTCHAEKRGPFVHPHDPVVDDCANCHNPHGSTVAGMLKARAPILCQQCHTPHVTGSVGAVGGQRGVFTPPVPGGTPAVTATSPGKNVVTIWQGRGCLNCHTQVHGSNNPSVTNPTPKLQLR